MRQPKNRTRRLIVYVVMFICAATVASTAFLFFHVKYSFEAYYIGDDVALQCAMYYVVHGSRPASWSDLELMHNVIMNNSNQFFLSGDLDRQKALFRVHFDLMPDTTSPAVSSSERDVFTSSTRSRHFGVDHANTMFWHYLYFEHEYPGYISQLVGIDLKLQDLDIVD